MINRLSNINVSELSSGGIFSKISSAFSVLCDTDGSDIILEGNDNLNLLHAEEALSALDKLTEDNPVDDRTVDYIIFLAGKGALNEFVNSADEVFYTTPTGRPVKARTLGQRVYLDALRRSDIVICSGPAGCASTRSAFGRGGSACWSKWRLMSAVPIANPSSTWAKIAPRLR